MSETKEPTVTTKTVLRAVVKEARSELKLINPDLRTVCRMLVDGLDALTGAGNTGCPAERVPEPVELRTAEPPATRVRKKKESDRSDRSDGSVG